MPTSSQFAKTRVNFIYAKTCVVFALVSVFMFCASIDKARSQVPVPPYQNQLLRLSELIGSIHFLSLVCRPDEPQVWYDKMQDILKVEGNTTLQRARLVERFNSGFKSFQSVYRKCSPSAETLLDQYLDEGEKIVDDLTEEFAG